MLLLFNMVPKDYNTVISCNYSEKKQWFGHEKTKISGKFASTLHALWQLSPWCAKSQNIRYNPIILVTCLSAGNCCEPWKNSGVHIAQV